MSLEERIAALNKLLLRVQEAAASTPRSSAPRYSSLEVDALRTEYLRQLEQTLQCVRTSFSPQALYPCFRELYAWLAAHPSLPFKSSV